MNLIKKICKNERLAIPQENICDINIRLSRIIKMFPDLCIDLSDSGEYELWLLEEYGKIGFKLYDAFTWVSHHKTFRTTKEYSDEEIFKMAKEHFYSICDSMKY